MESAGFTEFLAWERATRDTIDVKRAYMDMAGDLAAGVMLSQLLFHLACSRNSPRTVVRENFHWVRIERDEWFEEIRASARTADGLIVKLRRRELVVAKRFRGRNGLVQMHFRINEPMFLAAWRRAIGLPAASVAAGPTVRPPDGGADLTGGLFDAGGAPESRNGESRIYANGESGFTDSVNPEFTDSVNPISVTRAALRLDSLREDESKKQQQQRTSDGAPETETGRAVVVALLHKSGVSLTVATDLAARFDAHLIEAWCEARKYSRPPMGAGGLRRALEEGWSFPDGYLAAIKREVMMRVAVRPAAAPVPDTETTKRVLDRVGRLAAAAELRNGDCGRA